MNASSGRMATGRAPVGVRGWLLLLVLGLMIGPILAVGGTYVEHLGAEDRFPGLAVNEQWKTYKALTLTASLIIAGLSFYAGYGLATRKDWSAVTRAKLIIWLTGLGGAVFLGLIVPLMAFGQVETAEKFVGLLIGSGFSAIIWTWYLSKSKRVRATYAVTPLFQAPAQPQPMKSIPATGRQSAMPPNATGELSEKLRELKHLHKEGLISEEVYVESQRMLLEDTVAK